MRIEFLDLYSSDNFASECTRINVKVSAKSNTGLASSKEPTAQARGGSRDSKVNGGQ